MITESWTVEGRRPRLGSGYPLTTQQGEQLLPMDTEFCFVRFNYPKLFS